MHILVVGGGMGGTILANNLARRLSGELEQGSSKITMLSATDKHMYQPGLLYVAVGKMSTTELYRDQKSLLEPSIDFHVDPVEKLEDSMQFIMCVTSSVLPRRPIGMPFTTESYPSFVSSLYLSLTSGVSTALGIKQFT